MSVEQVTWAQAWAELQSCISHWDTSRNEPHFHNFKEGNDRGFLFSGSRVGASSWMARVRSFTAVLSEGRQGTADSLTEWKGALLFWVERKELAHSSILNPPRSVSKTLWHCGCLSLFVLAKNTTDLRCLGFHIHCELHLPGVAVVGCHPVAVL